MGAGNPVAVVIFGLATPPCPGALNANDSDALMLCTMLNMPISDVTSEFEFQ